MAKINKPPDYKCLQGCGKRGTFIHCDNANCCSYSGNPYGVWRIPMKLKVVLPDEPG